MVALGSFVIVLILSLIIVRVATVALSMTGLASDVARFQARSAWTGTGFTTGESEQIVNHPVRRRILSWLMVARGAGLVTAVSTLVLSFANIAQSTVAEGLARLAALATALLALWLIARSQWLDKRMRRIIEKAIAAATDLETRDYASLLRLAGGYDVSELLVEPGDWLENRTLEDLKLPEEGVLVLGITRPKRRNNHATQNLDEPPQDEQPATSESVYIGSPPGRTTVRAGDTLTIYASREKVKQLDKRRAGWQGEHEHVQARQHERQRKDADQHITDRATE